MSFSALIATKKSLYKIEFSGTPCIAPFSNYSYTTGAPLFAYVDGIEFMIPIGFQSDLASIPHWFWSFITPEYAALVYPALLHDYLYSCPGIYTRHYADNVFYSAMIERGMSRYTASKMYWAVRWFGGRHFDNGNDCGDRL